MWAQLSENGSIDLNASLTSEQKNMYIQKQGNDKAHARVVIKATLVTDPQKRILVEISSRDKISHLQLIIAEMISDHFQVFENL